VDMNVVVKKKIVEIPETKYWGSYEKSCIKKWPLLINPRKSHSWKRCLLNLFVGDSENTSKEENDSFILTNSRFIQLYIQRHLMSTIWKIKAVFFIGQKLGGNNYS
jgi:hypothetical protein